MDKRKIQLILIIPTSFIVIFEGPMGFVSTIWPLIIFVIKSLFTNSLDSFLDVSAFPLLAVVSLFICGLTINILALIYSTVKKVNILGIWGIAFLFTSMIIRLLTSSEKFLIFSFLTIIPFLILSTRFLFTMKSIEKK